MKHSLSTIPLGIKVKAIITFEIFKNTGLASLLLRLQCIMRLVNELVGDKVTLKTKIALTIHVKKFVIILNVYPLIVYIIIELKKIKTCT